MPEVSTSQITLSQLTAIHIMLNNVNNLVNEDVHIKIKFV